MNAPHPTIRPRNLANVLADIRHAKRDYDDALTANDADAEDRATEAETRLEDLQAEFDVRLAESTGLTVEDFRKAYEDALL